MIPKRQKQKRDLKHLQRVRELGCYCCRVDGMGPTPASAHHIREGYGIAEKASDYETIPLCPAHHQTGAGGVIAVHRNYRAFVERYGSEREILERTVAEMDMI